MNVDALLNPLVVDTARPHGTETEAAAKSLMLLLQHKLDEEAAASTTHRDGDGIRQVAVTHPYWPQAVGDEELPVTPTRLKVDAMACSPDRSDAVLSAHHVYHLLLSTTETRPASVATPHPPRIASMPPPCSSPVVKQAVFSDAGDDQCSSPVPRAKDASFCVVAGCLRAAKEHTKCEVHKSLKLCQVADCFRPVQSRGCCKSHGGGARCKHPGCTKGAISKGRCRSHGGGTRCAIPNCPKWAQRYGCCVRHSKTLHKRVTY